MAIETTYSDNKEIITITLDRPQYANALDKESVESLISAVDEACNSSARLLVFKGNGKSFCGGFDLREIDSETDGSLAYRFLRLELLLQKIYYAPIHTLALAHGPVAGAGADIVAACKKRVVVGDATFRFPGVQFGVLLGTNRLRNLIGQHAYTYLLEQQRITVNDGLTNGFVHEVISESEQDKVVDTLYANIKRVSPTTSAHILQLDKQQGLIDMGLLANSVANPNFIQQVRQYWANAKALAKKKAQSAKANA